MNIDIVKDKCCGCRTCGIVCPTDSILFSNDKYGFEFPKVNASKCVQCGKCVTVCPAIHINANKVATVYNCGVAYSIDEKTRFEGSSGGLFGIFAEKVIADGGIVFGAAFDENLKLKTTPAQTVEELGPLYKSKYILCDTNYSFEKILKELNSGRTVLYCSSPCQISALKLFLRKDYKNLITVDFVCHGVGNQELFDCSIAHTEKKLNCKIRQVTLRYKLKKAASSHYYCYRCEKNGRNFEKKGLYFSFPYYNAYCKQLVYREACYDCYYATADRVGDITIGDFHTIRKYNRKIDRFAGVSMLLVNTSRGQELFESVSEKIYYKNMDARVLYQNNRFSTAGERPKERREFMETVANESFDTAVKQFLSPKRDWGKIVYYKLPKALRDIAMRLLGE